jgi:DNA-directed RNA polymerase specialized sigma24 family protein
MSLPQSEDALRLHERLLAGDDLARIELCEAFLQPLTNRLQASAPFADDHLIAEAAESALLDYLEAPHKYQPSLSALSTYLFRAARCDLLNLQEREARRQRHLESVELDGLPGNSKQSDQPLLKLVSDEENAAMRAVVDAVEAESTPAERTVLRLIIDGEKSTAPYADALGIGDRPAEEQQDVVKRDKDKMKKRLTRRYKDHG